MAQTTVTVRKAAHADIPELKHFLERFVTSGDVLPRTIDELQDLLGTIFIAEVEGQMAGCAALEIYSKKLAEIRSLAVSPDFQGMGIGRQLVEACVALAKEREVFEIMAISASDGFFQKCGFDYTLPRLRKAFFMQTRDELWE